MTEDGRPERREDEQPDEDVRGHRRVVDDDEEDVEGHVQPRRDTDIER